MDKEGTGEHMQYPKSILQPMGNQDFDPAAYASSETGTGMHTNIQPTG